MKKIMKSKYFHEDYHNPSEHSVNQRGCLATSQYDNRKKVQRNCACTQVNIH